MLKVLGLFFAFIGFYNLERFGLSLSSIAQLGAGIALFIAERVLDHAMFVRREKTRAYYRNRR